MLLHRTSGRPLSLAGSQLQGSNSIGDRPPIAPTYLELQRQARFQFVGVAQQSRAVEEPILTRGALYETVALLFVEPPQATHLPLGYGCVRRGLVEVMRGRHGTGVGGFDN